MPKDRCELLTDSKHQYFLPELFALVLWNTEGPGAAIDVTGVLPDGIDATLEEVD